MKKWSRAWKKSKRRGKKRKYAYTAPLHIRHKIMSSHLSKELRTTVKKRSVPLRKNDTVKIMRGKFKGKIGQVEKINLDRYIVYIKGMQIEKKDGTKVKVPFQASNLLITELNMDDKRRFSGKKWQKKEKKQ
jgi:large subunit ribosomal protein L24